MKGLGYGILALGYEVLGGLRIRVRGYGAVPCRKHIKNDNE